MGRTSNARERLLQVAFDLIWRQSYGSVSVDNICVRAKVKKGSFYHFFPSKSDLAVAAYEEHWQQVRLKYEQTFSPSVPPLQRIENFCKNLYESQCEKKLKTGRVLGCPFASVGSELSTQDEKIRQKSQEIFDHFSAYFETALRDAHQAGLIETDNFTAKSQAINCMVMGTMMQAKVKNCPEILRQLGSNVLQMIQGTVSAEAHPGRQFQESNRAPQPSVAAVR